MFLLLKAEEEEIEQKEESVSVSGADIPADVLSETEVAPEAAAAAPLDINDLNDTNDPYHAFRDVLDENATLKELAS